MVNLKGQLQLLRVLFEPRPRPAFRFCFCDCKSASAQPFSCAPFSSESSATFRVALAAAGRELYRPPLTAAVLNVFARHKMRKNQAK